VNPIAIYICNAVIVLAGIAAVVTGKVTWGEFLGLAVGLLTTTTQAGYTHAKNVVAARRAARAAKEAQKPPRTPSTLLPPTMMLVLAFAMTDACKPGTTPTQVLEAGTPIGNDVCALFGGVDDNGASRSICATLVELVEVAIPFIFADRMGRDAGPPALAQCDYVPLVDPPFCATSAERSRAVLAIVKARMARLVRDAGAP